MYQTTVAIILVGTADPKTPNSVIVMTFPAGAGVDDGNSESVTVPAGDEAEGEDDDSADDVGTPGGELAPLSTGAGPATVAVSVDETALPFSSVMNMTFGTAVGFAAPPAGELTVVAGVTVTVSEVELDKLAVSETDGVIVVVDVEVTDPGGPKVSCVPDAGASDVAGGSWTGIELAAGATDATMLVGTMEPDSAICVIVMRDVALAVTVAVCCWAPDVCSLQVVVSTTTVEVDVCTAVGACCWPSSLAVQLRRAPPSPCPP